MGSGKRLIIHRDGTRTEEFIDKVYPTPAEIEASEAALALELAMEAEIADDSVVIKADNAVRTLITARPQQIENYINNNVNNLAEAKAVLITLAKAVSMVGKQEFIDRG